MIDLEEKKKINEEIWDEVEALIKQIEFDIHYLKRIIIDKESDEERQAYRRIMYLINFYPNIVPFLLKKNNLLQKALINNDNKELLKKVNENLKEDIFELIAEMGKGCS